MRSVAGDPVPPRAIRTPLRAVVMAGGASRAVPATLNVIPGWNPPAGVAVITSSPHSGCAAGVPSVNPSSISCVPE